MTTVMKYSQEGQPERAHLYTKRKNFRPRHSKIYRARAIKTRLCGKAQLTERKESGRCMTSFAIPKDASSKDYACLCLDLYPVYTTARIAA